jgi:hypothetical protein
MLLYYSKPEKLIFIFTASLVRTKETGKMARKNKNTYLALCFSLGISRKRLQCEFYCLRDLLYEDFLSLSCVPSDNLKKKS